MPPSLRVLKQLEQAASLFVNSKKLTRCGMLGGLGSKQTGDQFPISGTLGVSRWSCTQGKRLEFAGRCCKQQKVHLHRLC